MDENYLSKWSICSVSHAMPLLGDLQSPTNRVKKFYQRWEHFKSWRDFTHLCDKVDIYDLHYAENNSELKWMKKINEKKQEKFQIAQKMKIDEMIGLIKKYDLRLIRVELEKRLELWLENYENERRLKEKERLRLEKIWQEEERLRKIAEEKERIEKEKAREKERIAREATRLPMDLRKLCIRNRMISKAIDSKAIEIVCCNSSIDEMRSVLDLAKDDEKAQYDAFCAILPKAQAKAAAKLAKLEAEKMAAKKKEMEKKPTKKKDTNKHHHN